MFHTDRYCSHDLQIETGIPGCAGDRLPTFFVATLPRLTMAFVLYGAVSPLGSGKVLARALTDKVVLPSDTPHGVEKQSVMDGMATNILVKAPSGPGVRVSTALSDGSLMAHLSNSSDTSYLLIVTPAMDNALVLQLWNLMEAEYRSCRQSGRNALVFEQALGRALAGCNAEMDEAVAQAQRERPRRAEDDAVVHAVMEALRVCRGETKCTAKKARKCFGMSVSVTFAVMAVVFAIISCPLK
jgi:hypothetical protein